MHRIPKQKESEKKIYQYVDDSQCEDDSIEYEMLAEKFEGKLNCLLIILLILWLIF